MREFVLTVILALLVMQSMEGEAMPGGVPISTLPIDVPSGQIDTSSGQATKPVGTGAGQVTNPGGTVAGQVANPGSTGPGGQVTNPGGTVAGQVPKKPTQAINTGTGQIQNPGTGTGIKP